MVEIENKIKFPLGGDNLIVAFSRILDEERRRSRLGVAGLTDLESMQIIKSSFSSNRKATLLERLKVFIYIKQNESKNKKH